MVVSVNDVNAIISQYLYGSVTTPEDLTSDSLVRNSDTKTNLQISNAEYFTTGPGRFASAAMSSLVDQFFRPSAWEVNGSPLPSLQPGTYSKAE
jgi:hypothetical protein